MIATRCEKCNTKKTSDAWSLGFLSCLDKKDKEMNRIRGSSLQSIFMILSVAVFGVMVILPGCGRTDNATPVVTPGSDFVLTNGRIYTVDSKQPWAEAIAVQGNEIVYVGSSKDAERFVGENTQVADLEGRMVLPGMIDSHLHAIAVVFGWQTYRMSMVYWPQFVSSRMPIPITR
jgi:hypothetical protein